MNDGDKEKSILYVGLDDSNHGNLKIDYEIWAAIFSTEQSHVEEKKLTKEKHRKRREYHLTLKDLSTLDYCFLIAPGINCRNRGDKLLSEVTFSLVTDYRLHHPFNELSILVDGKIDARQVSDIKSIMKGFDSRITILGYVKNKYTPFPYPHILTLADEQAHHLFSSYSLNELSQHSKRVELISN